MQGDNREDGTCSQRRTSDHDSRQMRPDRAQRLSHSLPQFTVMAPVVEERCTADDEHHHRQRDEQHPKADVRPQRIPQDDPLSRVRRFVLERLQGTHEQGRHEQDRGEDEQQFCSSDSALDGVHSGLYSAKPK
jgi:hypothetical protein